MEDEAIAFSGASAVGVLFRGKVVFYPIPLFFCYFMYFHAPVVALSRSDYNIKFPNTL